MSSTPQQLPKGPRRSGKRNKGQNIQNDLQRSAVSDNEVSLIQSQMNANTANAKGRRKSQAANKAHISGNVSDNPMPSKTQATPIKSAYAGPMFHHSPAASALPLPSFYSKSVPAKQPAPILEDRSEHDDISPPEISTPSKRESTPLDFLFDAARQQGGTPRGESPAGTRSIPTRSPAGRSPAPRETDSVFPFELDGATTPGESGIAFATSYKERMDSAKSTRSTSAGVRDMAEEERKAKTEGLKKLLYLSPSPRPPQAQDPSNPFNARAAPARPFSGQSKSPHHQNGFSNQYSNIANRPTSNDQFFSNQPARPPSHLRYEAASEPEPTELSSDSAITPPRVSTGRRDGNATIPQIQKERRDPAAREPIAHMQSNYAIANPQFGWPQPLTMNYTRPPPPPDRYQDQPDRRNFFNAPPSHSSPTVNGHNLLHFNPKMQSSYAPSFGLQHAQTHNHPGEPVSTGRNPNGASSISHPSSQSVQPPNYQGQRPRVTAEQMENDLRSVLKMGNLKLG